VIKEKKSDPASSPQGLARGFRLAEIEFGERVRINLVDFYTKILHPVRSFVYYNTMAGLKRIAKLGGSHRLADRIADMNRLHIQHRKSVK
jgi:hypothetical protein